MARAPFQILVIPYQIFPDGEIRYAVFKRADAGYWQGIAGGGENGETPLAAARREAQEEAGIDPRSEFLPLDSLSTIPVVGVGGFAWGNEVLVIPQHCFGVRVLDERLSLSGEHTEYAWLTYDQARSHLHWQSNKNALWELNHRLKTRS